ncbi:MAG: MoaD/ThiS family protein [Firmicutes bacterium]|nr:MoaD/ThiS family protein [Bacillota bacterium]
MKIKVVYVGPIRTHTRTAEEVLEVAAGTTVSGLLALLCEHHGDGFRDSIFLDGGHLANFARVLLDGEDQYEAGGLERNLDGVQEVSILLIPSMAGGRF